MENPVTNLATIIFGSMLTMVAYLEQTAQKITEEVMEELSDLFYNETE